MVSIKDLEIQTEEFFKKFCNDSIIENQPIWSNKWNFAGKLPNNESKGLYAHIHNDYVTYIGLGISKSYNGSGIGSRVSKYWKKSANHSSSIPTYIPTVDNIDSIITLPFGKDNFYLAPALEIYLIQKLKTPKNSVHCLK